MGQSDPRISSLENKVNALSSLQTQVNNLDALVKNSSKAVATQINTTDIANSFASNPFVMSKLSDDIVTSQQMKIAQPVANEMIKNQDYAVVLSNKLLQNSEFTNSVAKSFADNPEYQLRFRGAKGEPGELALMGDVSVKANLSSQQKPRTLWCADGDVCVLPPGKRGISMGENYMTDTWIVGKKIGNPGWSAFMENGNIVGTNISSNGNITGRKITTDAGAYLEGGNIVGNNVTVGDSYLKPDKLGLQDDKAYMDAHGGGRVYAKNQVQIGNWVIYEKDDGHLVFYKANKGDLAWINDKGQMTAEDNFYSKKNKRWI